jgi:tape measure domain-containing protein
MSDGKVQLEAELDASRVKQGAAEVTGAVRQMGREVEREAGRVSAATAKMGSGGERAAQSTQKAERSIIASIQRQTAAYEAGGRSTREYYEAIARQRGIGADVLKPYLDQLDAAKEKQAEAAQGAKGFGDSLGMVRAGIAGIVGGALVGWAKQTGDALFDASVSAERLRTMLNFATGNSARDIEYLRGITQKLGLEMQSTATAYGQFAAAAKGTTLEGQKTRDVFESIAKASAVMGLSANQTSGVLLALQQMVSKGTVQAEELRGQLGERLPGAFQVAARAMGVTTGELGKMLEQGQVVADDFLPKFARALNEYVGDAAESAATRLEASQSRMSNAWERLMQAVGDSGISSAMAVGMESAASSIDAIAVAMEAARRSGDGMGGQLLAAAGAAYKLLDPVDRLTVNLYDNERASKAAWERLRDLEAQAARGVNVRAEYQQVINLINTLQIARHEMAKLRQEASGVANIGDRPRDLREDNPSMTRGASYARWAKEQADAEKGLAEVRMKAAGVNKSYFEDLGKWQAALRAGVIGEKEYIEQVSKLATETWKASAAGKEAAGSKRAGAKASNEAARAAEREAAAISNFMTSLREKIAAQELELQGGEKLTQADRLRLDFQSKLISGALKLTAAQKEKAEAEIRSFEANEKALKLQQEQARVYEQASKDYDKYVGTMVREAETLAQRNKSLEDEIGAMGLTGRALVDLERKRIDEQITALKAQHSTAVLAGARDDETAAIRRQIAELERYRELIGQRADKSAAVEEAQRAEEEWKRAADSINQSLTDALMRGFESGKGFASNFRDTLKNMFRTLVLRPIISFVVQPIGNLIQGAIGGLLGGGQGGAGNLLGTASNMQSAYKWLSGGYQDTFRSAAAPAVSYGGQALTGLTWGGKPIASSAVTGFNGTALSQSPGMTISAAGIAAIAAPLIIGSLIERNSRDRFSGAAYATSGGNDPFVNTVAGSTSFDYLTGDLPDRAALMARLEELGAPMEAISDWNDRALLRLMESAAADNSEFGINWTSRVRDMRDTPDFYRGAGYAHPEELGWWDNKDNANLSTDPALIQASRDIALSIIGPLEGIGALIGDEAAYRATVGFANRGEGNGLWAGLNLQRDGQNVADWVNTDDFHSVGEAVRAMYSTALGTLDSFDLPGWADKQVTDARAALDALEGENMGQEAAALYAQTTAGIEQMYRSIQMLIDVFPDFSAATQDSVFALQELMGGMDQLQGAYSSYLQNFWSDEERADLMRKQLGLELGKVGLSLPETRDAFRDLVEAQDLSTEAGREAFAALMGVAGAFAEITPAAEAAARHTDDVWNRLNQLFNEQIDNWKQLASEAKSIFTTADSAARALRGNVSDTRAWDAAQGNAFIDAALAAARASGALPDADALKKAIDSARGGLDMGGYDTVAEYERDQLLLAGKLSELGDVAGNQMSFAEQQVKLLEDQREYWKKQLDLLNTTGLTISSIDEGVSYLADYVRAEQAKKDAAAAEAAEQAKRSTIASSRGDWGGGWGGGGWGGGGGQDLTRTINWDTGEYVYPDGSGGTLSPEELEYFRRIRDGEISPTRVIDDLYQVPRHADGGRYAGGLALVGERGPELINFASPGYVYTAAQTRDMMRGGDNAELIAELRELRARLDKIERNTAVLPQTHDVIDRVTAGGNAMLTEAA